MRIFFSRRGALGMLLLGSCWLASTLLQAGDKLTLHLVYTSDTIGYVDACG